MSFFERLYDVLEQFWERANFHRRTVDLLLLIFIVSLAVITVKRQGVMPEPLASYVPSSHFRAIEITFDALLIYEVMGLVFGLVRSVSNSVGKQFEILGLILIRKCFEDFVEFDEPIAWEQVSEMILPIAIDGFGALLIFGLLGAYYRIQQHQAVARAGLDQTSFIRAKKIVALALLFGYVFILAEGLILQLDRGYTFRIFGTFYTMLIFSDILIVLISMRYTTQFRIVFRNFGFALATVSIRLALTAPVGYDVLIGMAGLIYAFVLSLLYNLFAEDLRNGDADHGATSKPSTTEPATAGTAERGHVEGPTHEGVMGSEDAPVEAASASSASR